MKAFVYILLWYHSSFLKFMGSTKQSLDSESLVLRHLLKYSSGIMISRSSDYPWNYWPESTFAIKPCSSKLHHTLFFCCKLWQCEASFCASAAGRVPRCPWKCRSTKRRCGLKTWLTWKCELRLTGWGTKVLPFFVICFKDRSLWTCGGWSSYYFIWDGHGPLKRS